MSIYESKFVRFFAKPIQLFGPKHCVASRRLTRTRRIVAW